MGIKKKKITAISDSKQQKKNAAVYRDLRANRNEGKVLLEAVADIDLKMANSQTEAANGAKTTSAVGMTV